MANGKLAGRVAVITGGSKGLGKAMAESLGRAGATLALVARNATELGATAKELKAAGAEAEAFPADVTKEADVRRIEQAVVQRFGKVHILINNAGINIRKSITEFSLEEWNRVVDTSLTAAFLCCRSFVPHKIGRASCREIGASSRRHGSDQVKR